MEIDKDNALKSDIVKYIQLLHQASEEIPDQKRSRLIDLALYITSKLKSKIWVKMVFLSLSDNSLSQIGQIWAQSISSYIQLNGLEVYSAGKNNKRINPEALNAISHYGFEVKKAKNGDQPVYAIKYADNKPAIKLFSKPLKHPENPGEGYVALVINQFEQEMPLIPGADFKVPLNYEIKPGENDDEKYDRICQQIGTDMLFIFSNLGETG